jgi:hypothetical protein
MAAIQDIITGDDIILAVTLKRNGAIFPIDDSSSAGSEVKAMLVSTDHKKKYMTEPVIQSSTADGADWEQGIVVIQFSESDTSEIIYQGNALIEIQVEKDGIKKTWFVLINIVKGNIE